VRNSIRPEKLDREVARVRRALYFDLGVPFPGVHLRLNDNLSEGEYRIMVNEIPVASGAARPGHFIVRETEANLKMFDIPFERGGRLPAQHAELLGADEASAAGRAGRASRS